MNIINTWNVITFLIYPISRLNQFCREYMEMVPAILHKVAQQAM